jgi:hypothetical protein
MRWVAAMMACLHASYDRIQTYKGVVIFLAVDGSNAPTQLAQHLE